MFDWVKSQRISFMPGYLLFSFLASRRRIPADNQHSTQHSPCREGSSGRAKLSRASCCFLTQGRVIIKQGCFAGAHPNLCHPTTCFSATWPHRLKSRTVRVGPDVYGGPHCVVSIKTQEDKIIHWSGTTLQHGKASPKWGSFIKPCIFCTGGKYEYSLHVNNAVNKPQKELRNYGVADSWLWTHKIDEWVYFSYTDI